MTPELAELKFVVKKATDMEPFTVDGKRHIGYHFFYLKGSVWQFRWVDKDTDPQWLQEKIAEGLIYIFND